MLSYISKISQNQYEDLLDFTIKKGKNLLVFGYAGIGKTVMAKDRIDKAKLNCVYTNLSTLEGPDLNGLPVNKVDYMDFIPPKWLAGHTDPYVLLIDELDKAKMETQNPLLELTQFRSINGRKMPIKAIIATANHPEEYAGQNIINHALTNRFMIYELEVQPSEWLQWAVKNNIHDLITSYISKNTTKLSEPPNTDDITAYCRATPRSWTLASEDLKDYLEISKKASIEQQIKIISARVGDATAVELELWLKYYSELDDLIDRLVETGEQPDVKDCIEKCYMVSISSIRRMINIKDKEKRMKSATYVSQWMENVVPDIRAAVLKSSLSQKEILDLGLMKNKEFKQMVIGINRMMGHK